ncbi:MAG: hypothetical protein K2K69_10395, partial [Muribaculaceae bacterium]|nr:hypothetical protein [Muribaculaceae bacterium]
FVDKIQNAGRQSEVQKYVEEARDYAAKLVKEGKVDEAKAYLEKIEPIVQEKAPALVGTLQTSESALDKVKDFVGDKAEAAENAAESAVGSVKDAAGDAAEATSNAAENVADKAGDIFNAAKEKAGDAVEATKDGASKAVEATKDGASKAVEATKNGASKAVDATKQKAEDLKNALTK